MRGQKHKQPQCAQPEQDVQVLIDPMLRLLVVEAIDIIEIDRQIGISRVGAGGRGEPVAGQHQLGGHHGPAHQRPSIVAQPEQEPDEQERQPAMEQRQPARKQWQLTVKHVTRQVQNLQPQQMTAKIHEPETLRQQNPHGAQADEQGIFQPHARHREQQRGIAEPEEIGRPVGVQINRYQQGEKRRGGDFRGQRNFAVAHVQAVVRMNRARYRTMISGGRTTTTGGPTTTASRCS